MKNPLENFSFTALDDPTFKEDAVREEIIAPLLRSIGYSATGPYRIVRSKVLTHPYVMFGSTKRKLNIIPDYTLITEDIPRFVLDAKAPTESVTEGDNVAQVFSYAIHPEIRAWNYGLCNGRQLALFDVRSIAPKQVYDLTRLNESSILDINQKLNPRSIKDDGVLGFALDGGIYLHIVMDMPLDMTITFTCVPVVNLGKLSEDAYTMNVTTTGMADRDLMLTFDFSRDLLAQLFEQLSSEEAEVIRQQLVSQPFMYRGDESSPRVHISCMQTTDIQFSRSGEMFIPLRVTEFKRV
jgi:hypothetical protein